MRIDSAPEPYCTRTKLAHGCAYQGHLKYMPMLKDPEFRTGCIRDCTTSSSQKANTYGAYPPSPSRMTRLPRSFDFHPFGLNRNSFDQALMNGDVAIRSVQQGVAALSQKQCSSPRNVGNLQQARTRAASVPAKLLELLAEC
jgi:hypothetical protein